MEEMILDLLMSTPPLARVPPSKGGGCWFRQDRLRTRFDLVRSVVVVLTVQLRLPVQCTSAYVSISQHTSAYVSRW
jgi:hypothetical protein